MEVDGKSGKKHHGLHAGVRRQSVIYRQQKIKLQAELMPALGSVKRYTSSMLDTMESALASHLSGSEKDGVDLDETMLDDIVEMCTLTRAYQMTLEELTQVINKT